MRQFQTDLKNASVRLEFLWHRIKYTKEINQHLGYLHTRKPGRINEVHN